MKINTDIKVTFNPKKQNSCPCIAIGTQQIRPLQSKSKCVLYIYQKTMFGVCFSRCVVAKKTKAIRGKTYDKWTWQNLTNRFISSIYSFIPVCCYQNKKIKYNHNNWSLILLYLYQRKRDALSVIFVMCGRENKDNKRSMENIWGMKIAKLN